MAESYSFFEDLSSADITEIKSCAVIKQFKENEVVFSEGDAVDSFYIIESGKVSISIEKNGKNELICVLSQNDYFGEMAVFNNDSRTASAIANSDLALLCIDKDQFLSFVRSHPVLAEKINVIFSKRNEELLLRESLIGATGIDRKKLYISIKGDPSLRESAFSRERYESVVDKLLPELEPVLEDLLLNRCVYKVFINFNSGEIRTSTIFDPFNEEVHTANKLIGAAYIERHFTKIPYQDKSDYIKRIFDFISTDLLFGSLPSHLKKIFRGFHDDWQSVDKTDISSVMTQLITLRGIQSFYLRNFSISMIQDAIRMQFNCDGTHFVSAENYQRFLEENLD